MTKMKRISRMILWVILIVSILLSTAGAEWRKVKEWQYNQEEHAWEEVESWKYYEKGAEVSDFSGYQSLTVPEEVDSLSRGYLKNIQREFFLKVTAGS